MDGNINVEVLKTLYNQEKDKLKELKEKLDEVLREKEMSANDLEGISVEYNDLEMNLNEIKIEQANLFNKYRNLLLAITFVSFGIFGVLGLISLLGVFTLDSLLLAKVIKSIIDIDKMILGSFGLLVGLVGIEYFLGKKLIDFLENKFENIMYKIEAFFARKVENSEQNKELANLESILLGKLEAVKSKKDELQQNKDDLSTEYDNLKEEYEDKKRLVDYLDRLINPTEMTMSLSRGLRNDINQ